MTPPSHTSRTLATLFYAYLVDAVIFFVSFLLATYVRFGEVGPFQHMVPSILCGVLAFGSSSYVFGLYSTRPQAKSRVRDFSRLLFAIVMGLLAVLLAGYVNYSGRIGRGVFAGALPILLLGLTAHRASQRYYLGSARERIVFLVTKIDDLALLRFFDSLSKRDFRLIGVVCPESIKLGDELIRIGGIDNLEEIVANEKITRVVCSDEFIASEESHSKWRRLRYQGIEVSTMGSFCEEFYQFIPIELVNASWLMRACSAPQTSYVRKTKRLTDLVLSSLLAIILSPLLLLGILLIVTTMPGSIFYVQERVGQFGRLFKVYKLRSMREDAESSGAVWSSGKDDPRQTVAGKFLRRYRIDEIPQLWNVWKGEMSLVGPRPERPEFVARLSEVIPYYEERHFAQPGLTGWAQVSYPYGASIQDSRHKLEYDLYYLKHMNQFIDFAILLETVRTVVCGGVKFQRGDTEWHWLSASLEYSRERKETKETKESRKVV